MTKKTPDPMDVHLGSRVRARRVQLNHSQEWLADKLGLTFQQVQKYEKGTNRMGGSRMAVICDALGISVDWLYQGAPGRVGRKSLAVDEDMITITTCKSGQTIIAAFAKMDPRARASLADTLSVLVGV